MHHHGLHSTHGAHTTHGIGMGHHMDHHAGDHVVHDAGHHDAQTIHLDAHDKVSATLCKVSYALPKHSGVEGATSLDRAQNALQQAVIDNPGLHGLNDLHVVSSSVDHFTVSNSTGTECHFVIRGSDFVPGQHTMVRDLANDLQQFFGVPPHRAETMKAEYLKFKADNPNCKVYIDAHSLGGTIAIEIGKADHTANVTTFESGTGPNNHYEGGHDNIHNHKIWSDPVGWGDSAGRTTYHPSPDNGLGPHTIYNY